MFCSNSGKRFLSFFLILSLFFNLYLSLFPSKILAQINFDEARVRYILVDSQLGGVIGYYRGHPEDPNSVEAVRRWDQGVRVVNSDLFERKIVDNWTITYKGTNKTINALVDVKLTTDSGPTKAPEKVTGEKTFDFTTMSSLDPFFTKQEAGGSISLAKEGLVARSDQSTAAFIRSTEVLPETFTIEGVIKNYGIYQFDLMDDSWNKQIGSNLGINEHLKLRFHFDNWGDPRVCNSSNYPCDNFLVYLTTDGKEKFWTGDEWKTAGGHFRLGEKGKERRIGIANLIFGFTKTKDSYHAYLKTENGELLTEATIPLSSVRNGSGRDYFLFGDPCNDAFYGMSTTMKSFKLTTDSGPTKAPEKVTGEKTFDFTSSSSLDPFFKEVTLGGSTSLGKDGLLVSSDLYTGAFIRTSEALPNTYVLESKIRNSAIFQVNLFADSWGGAVGDAKSNDPHLKLQFHVDNFARPAISSLVYYSPSGKRMPWTGDKWVESGSLKQEPDLLAGKTGEYIIVGFKKTTDQYTAYLKTETGQILTEASIPIASVRNGQSRDFWEFGDSYTDYLYGVHTWMKSFKLTGAAGIPTPLPTPKNTLKDWQIENVSYFKGAIYRGEKTDWYIMLRNKDGKTTLPNGTKTLVTFRLYDLKDTAKGLVMALSYPGEVIDKVDVGRSDKIPGQTVLKIPDVILFPAFWPDTLDLTVSFEKKGLAGYLFFKRDISVEKNPDVEADCAYGMTDAGIALLVAAGFPYAMVVDVGKDVINFGKDMVSCVSGSTEEIKSHNYQNIGKRFACEMIAVGTLVDPLKLLAEAWSYVTRMEACVKVLGYAKDFFTGAVQELLAKGIPVNIVILGSPAEMTLSSGNKQIGVVNGNVVNDFGEPNQVITGHPMIVMLKGTLPYNLQVTGKEEGSVNLSVIGPRENGQVVRSDYNDVKTVKGELMTLAVKPESNLEKDFNLAIDKNNDGKVDEYKKPDKFELITLPSKQKLPSFLSLRLILFFLTVALIGFLVIIFLLKKTRANANIGEKSKTRFCRNCGKEIPVNVKFCKNCGQKI